MFIDQGEHKVFRFGQEDDAAAEQAALLCGGFIKDYEEECFAEEEVTCYNCRYRRWTADSFECMKRS
ncbi:MAG: hypothetical protein E7328_06330 [Clostridiales bacterium]|nr:hypothetical protein [Clostridiales bacterium]